MTNDIRPRIAQKGVQSYWRSSAIRDGLGLVPDHFSKPRHEELLHDSWPSQGMKGGNIAKIIY